MKYLAVIRPPNEDVVYWAIVEKEKVMSNLDRAFEEAKKMYPQSISLNISRWQLVDAVAASFRTPDREGMLVLREDRQGCHEPFYHWGFMIAKVQV